VRPPARRQSRVVDLLCVGESFEDLIFAGLSRPPRLGEELRTDTFVRTFGGGATITAVAAARLGVRTGILSGLSADAEARLRSEGVHVRNLRRPNEAHAITAALSTERDRAFATFDGINSKLGPRIVRALANASARHVHVAMAPRDPAGLARAIARIRRTGATVSFDFGFDLDLARDRRFEKLLEVADLLLVNEAEARLYSRRSTLDAAIEWWRARAPRTVVKRGARGSLLVTPDAVLRVPAPRTRAVDTTGAGDAFNAGFLAAFLAGRDATSCLREGNRVGALSTRALGGLDGLPRG
jgi:sugar/nucleoside kinase (ribokinase family)